MKKRIYLAAMLALATVTFTSCFKEDPDVMTGLIGYYSFDNSDGTDQSGNGHTGSFTGKADPSFIDGIRGKALYINGDNNNAFEIPYVFFKELDEWTVSFWAKDLNAGTIFSPQDLTINTRVYDVPRLYADKNTKALGIQMQSDYGHTFGYNYTQNNSQWNHIVVVVDSLVPVQNAASVRVRLYVNGRRESKINGYYYKSYINRCSQTVFGGNKNRDTYISIDAKLDEIRIYNRALKTEDIKALYELEY